jgi:hypothetical protein
MNDRCGRFVNRISPEQSLTGRAAAMVPLLTSNGVSRHAALKNAP